MKKDDKSVRDVINTLLRQLDLSWMDADLSLTTEILKIVCIFVSNLDIEYQQNELKNTEVKEEKGKITKLIKGMIRKWKYETIGFITSVDNRQDINVFFERSRVTFKTCNARHK